MSEVWADWEGQVVNGVFPLRRFLGGSDHGGVFLTDFKAGNLPNAALKLVPAIPTLTEAQISHWTAAAALLHPHLIRILESGRCRLGGLQFLFVVMEYAEQTLAQILPQRALTPDEVREMLLPILAALAFLHRRHLVQGQLKPSNILVVGDQLKLASDTIRPAGEPAASIAQPSVYDPPEATDGSISAAGDLWGLGITLVEALTQHPPAWPERRYDTVSLPTTFPAMFAGVVRQCLDPDPANRPTVADLDAQLKPLPQAPVVPAPQPTASVPAPPVSAPQPLVSVPQSLASLPDAVVRELPSRAAPPKESPKRYRFAAAIAVVLVVLLAVWAGSRSSRTSRNPETSPSAPPAADAPSSSTQTSSAQTADPKSAPSRRISGPSDQSSANDSPIVLHEEIPDVPRSARSTIHGRIKVAVRVTVDSSGNVIDAALENRGASKYFARLATDAAKKWKFAPANSQDSRKWLLRFEFTRGGAVGHAANTNGP
jgi:TonB family protein